MFDVGGGGWGSKAELALSASSSGGAWCHGYLMSYNVFYVYIVVLRGAMSVMSVRLSDEVELQLGALAQATGRTKSWLANQAIQDYLAREAWQVAEIEAALNEADAGDFVLEQEMEARFNRWGINAG